MSNRDVYCIWLDLSNLGWILPQAVLQTSLSANLSLTLYLSDSWQVHICHPAKIPPPPYLFLCSSTPSPLHYHYSWQWIIVQLTFFFSANARCYWQPQHETRLTFTWFPSTIYLFFYYFIFQIGLHQINGVTEPLHHGKSKVSFGYVCFRTQLSCRIHTGRNFTGNVSYNGS